MMKSITKSRPANYYANQVKVLIILVVGILFLNSPNARNFVGDGLRTVADVVDTY